MNDVNGTGGRKYVELAPEELAECQRRFAAAERARQDYQDFIDAVLAERGIDHRGRDVQFNPWTGRFVVPHPPETVAPQKAG